MKARVCDRCGGKLPNTDQRIIECEYCGTPFEMYEGPEMRTEAHIPRYQVVGSALSHVFCNTAAFYPDALSPYNG